MFTYKYRNTFFQELHPLTGILLIFLYFIGFLLIKNPIYMILIMLSLIFLSYFDGCTREVLKFTKFIIPFAFLIIILNPILVKNGNTVLYNGDFKIPLIGTVRITLEAIIYGIVSGLRIICITIVFAIGNLIIHPDRSFGFFSKYLKKSALLMSMTIRLFPRLIKSYNNIQEIEKIRGNIVRDKSLKKRIKNQGNIINILFLSSLEDSADIAEAMYSRGYGIGKRSSYFHEKFNFGDIILILILIFIYAYLILYQGCELNEMKFYPLVDNPLSKISIQGFILCSFFFIPGIINWGWKKWK